MFAMIGATLLCGAGLFVIALGRLYVLGRAVRRTVPDEDARESVDRLQYDDLVGVGAWGLIMVAGALLVTGAYRGMSDPANPASHVPRSTNDEAELRPSACMRTVHDAVEAFNDLKTTLRLTEGEPRAWATEDRRLVDSLVEACADADHARCGTLFRQLDERYDNYLAVGTRADSPVHLDRRLIAATHDRAFLLDLCSPPPRGTSNDAARLPGADGK